MNFFLKIKGKFWRIFSLILGPSWLKASGVRVNSPVILYGLPIIQCERGAAITIGSRSVLCSLSEYTALGISRPIILRAMSADASIIIGNDVGMSGTTICSDSSVIVGNSCLFGADVMISDTDFHPVAAPNRRYSKDNVKSIPVVIGDNVFLGARSVVLKGVHIGSNSVIGAGSIVTRDIPANVIAAGNPCRVIGVIPVIEAVSSVNDDGETA